MRVRRAPFRGLDACLLYTSSDHCRHTTFGTELTDIAIDDACVQAAFDKYLAMRAELGREHKPVCLMDMGTIGAKYLKAKGIMKNVDESEEINACTVKVTVDVNGCLLYTSRCV